MGRFDLIGLEGRVSRYEADIRRNTKAQCQRINDLATIWKLGNYFLDIIPDSKSKDLINWTAPKDTINRVNGNL